MVVLRQTTDPSEVVLVHSPYPGRLKFQGIPSSLFAAIGPFVVANPERAVSYLDPRGPSESFHDHLGDVLTSGKVRVLCISTSTAAIEETARIASIAAARAPETLVVVGGPHEDGVDRKTAEAVSGVHFSISGDAESALRAVLELFLSCGRGASEFVDEFTPAQLRSDDVDGQFMVACSAWPSPLSFDNGPSKHKDPRPLVFPKAYPRFDIFDAPATIPLMVSRGCAYGRCTFCAEANRDGTVTRTADYDWVFELAHRVPDAALYFQDSIFPGGNGARSDLLPRLRDHGREWGCQVFLPMLTERRVAELAEHGCTYLYTGVESGSQSVLDGVRKPNVTRALILERMMWAEHYGVRVGISLMFGAMLPSGELLESEETLRDTHDLAETILDSGVRVAGFYPNVQTALPGTQLARGLAESGFDLDFYTMPRANIFDPLEDGGVGYNYLTIAEPSCSALALAERIVAVAQDIQALSGRVW